VLVGEDDVVVSQEEALRLKQHLEGQENQVVLKMVRNLPHNRPENASFYVKSFIADLGII
jgi:hypothetical protein